MTMNHVLALLIAAVLLIACAYSGRCSDKMIDNASNLATVIAVGTIGHAGQQMLKLRAKPDPHDDRRDT